MSFVEVDKKLMRRLTYTVEEAARVLGIGRSSAYEAARAGQIPTIRIGRRLLVPVRALEQMLSGHSAGGGGNPADAGGKPVIAVENDDQVRT